MLFPAIIIGIGILKILETWTLEDELRKSKNTHRVVARLSIFPLEHDK